MSVSALFDVICPAGILDGTRVDELRAEVDHLLGGASPVVLIDLSDTTFVDSSGLGVLVSILKRVRAAGRQFCVCGPNAQIKMVFELSGMDQAFDVFESRAAFEASMLPASA